VRLDVPEVHTLLDRLHLVQFSRPSQDVRVFPNQLSVRLEVHRIDLVKADDGHKQANVGHCQLVAADVARLRENETCVVVMSLSCHAMSCHAVACQWHGVCHMSCQSISIARYD